MALANLQKLYTGSVKDVYAIGDTLLFHFTDRYSIYDWGQMPDLIDEKGIALAATGRLLLEQVQNKDFWHNWKFPEFLDNDFQSKITNCNEFKKLSEQGLATHLIGQVDDDLNTSTKGRNLQVAKVNVLRPAKTEQGYDYSAYQSAPPQTLIPLEVIFRLGLPTGSSFAKRVNKNPEYLKTFGITELPKANEFFPFPVVEFSTKLEPSDRYLSYAEASSISAMDQQQFQSLIRTTQLMALRLYQLFNDLGLTLWDGKFEFAWDSQRQLMLVDSIGLDELRILTQGQHLSKEFLRQYYVGNEWHSKLDHYKTNYGEQWKKHMLQDGLAPKALGSEYKRLAVGLYQSFANALSTHFGQGTLFDSAPSLSQWAQEVGALQNQKKINVLVIGSGGREHALAWKISSSPQCQNLWVSPGNAGMEFDGVQCVSDLNEDDQLLNFIQQNQVGLVVIGPEAPLVAGVADMLRKNGVKVFGPGKEGALLEASKSFSKRIMQKAGIPTAEFEEFDDAEKAFHFIDRCHWEDGMVVKIDGLAAGKGVVVCDNRTDAKKAVKELVIDNILNLTDTKVIIEEKYVGREVSAFALVDGDSFRTLGLACDYKRVRDNDQGPNTGGMGTYGPAFWVSAQEVAQIDKEVFAPLVKTLRAEKIDYRGVIFAGLIQTKKGMRVLEFNARFGDPETQSLLPRISSDLLPYLLAVAEGKLKDTADVEFSNQSVVHVVAAAHGYPGTEGTPVRSGDTIELSDEIKKLDSNKGKVFFAGVKSKDNQLVTSGGRVLGVSSFGADLDQARAGAYQLLENIQFQGMHYRGDIAKF